MDEQTVLSRRERQILEIVYANGEAGATEVWAAMGQSPSRTAVRTFLTILERKGLLVHRLAKREYIYRPTRARALAGKSALRRVLEVFFSGSLEGAVAAHLSDPRAELSKKELARLSQLIKEARKKGR